MGLFDIFKKKEKPAEIQANVRFVTDNEGDKYLHIQDFAKMLENYKMSFNNPTHKAILDQIIRELNNA